MGDLHRTPVYPVARKRHRWIACYGPIPVSERYTQQSGFFEGSAYRSRYHDECWATLSEGDDFEFLPGELDIPERLLVPLKDTTQ